MFDISNGDEFENNVLYVDNVTSGDSFFTASDTNVRSTTITFSNNDIGGDFFRVNGTFSSSSVTSLACIRRVLSYLSQPYLTHLSCRENLYLFAKK